MPSLVTSADAKAYIAARSTAWESARLASGSLKG
jgi:hypothetical protein